ncbi:MAG: hypothetical protein GX127_03830 [Eubacteriaceae bacterium]|jgi:hypothetical protein|nr:hypothetical protein [Eubacteriaceae bacterium]
MLQIDFQPFAAIITIDDSKDLDLETSKKILITLIETFADALNQSAEKLIIGHIKAIIDTDKGYIKASLTEAKGRIHIVGDAYEQKKSNDSQITLNSVIAGATKESENEALNQAIQQICDLYDIEVHVSHEHHHEHDHNHDHHHHDHEHHH